MKKNNLNLWVLAALVCGLSLSVTSCKDDDKNELSAEEQREQQAAEQSEKTLKFWSVVGQLVSMDDYTDNYADAQFEPTIGTEGSDQQTRVVYTNDAAAAATRFANLVGLNSAEITEATSSYTWNDPEVGTLTYTKVTDGTAWATVNVDIKQVKHLTTLIYRAPNQEGDNWGHSVGDGGSAYYRFGDVISRVRPEDGVKEYWICVRPAFEHENKGNSHWMSVSPVPAKNHEKYTSSHDKDYVMPKGLAYNKEHMQNMAEMLYAIYEPKGWYDNVVNCTPKGMKMFNDFKLENLTYHNDKFWQNVQNGWKKKNVAKTVFGVSDDELKKQATQEGLYMLYCGYSWHWSRSNYLSLYQHHYTNTPKSQYANMQTKDPYQKVETMVVDKKDESGNSDIVVNIAEDCTAESPYFVNSAFFGDNHKRYIVRYATDKQLSSTKKYGDNQVAIPGTEEVYRYYSDIFPEKNLKDAPETTEEVKEFTVRPQVGEAGTYMLGDVVQDGDEGRWFCIAGSPYVKNMYDFAKDSTAWFITLDKTSGLYKERASLISEEDLPEVGLRFMIFIQTLEQMASKSHRLDIKEGVKGSIGQHIYDHTGVDLTKIVNCVDSTWKFTSYKDKQSYTSKSVSYVFNVAYGNADANGNYPIARFICDVTQAGDRRGDCYAKSGKLLQNWRFLCYKNYATYDSTRVTLSEDEESVGMTKWQGLWPTTNDKMMLNDVANQAMIDKYAKGDKWQKKPRTKAETNVSTEDFYWDEKYERFYKTSIFKEPVLFLHLMKVIDNGGNKPKKTSTKNTYLHFQYLQDDEHLYRGRFQALYAGDYAVDSQTVFYMNGELFKVKQISGFEDIK